MQRDGKKDDAHKGRDVQAEKTGPRTGREAETERQTKRKAHRGEQRERERERRRRLDSGRGKDRSRSPSCLGSLVRERDARMTEARQLQSKQINSLHPLHAHPQKQHQHQQLQELPQQQTRLQHAAVATAAKRAAEGSDFAAMAALLYQRWCGSNSCSCFSCSLASPAMSPASLQQEKEIVTCPFTLLRGNCNVCFPALSAATRAARSNAASAIMMPVSFVSARASGDRDTEAAAEGSRGSTETEETERDGRMRDKTRPPRRPERERDTSTN